MEQQRNIDQYFRAATPAEDAGERRPSIRRVSFAPEPPTIYHPLPPTESSSMNMSMDLGGRHSAEMTLEEAAGEESIQEHESLPVCEDREENFIMEDSDSTESKRMSLCPAEAEKSMEQTMHEYSLGEERDDIVSDMLSEIICAGESNTLVYDTVNVEEVLSKYESTKRKEARKIRDILAETGIRFLDNLSLTNRRETLSKIRNRVEPEKVSYYREYLQKRIDMQNAFSSGVSGEIEKIKESIEHLEREIDCAQLTSTSPGTLSSRLRQLKSDARREAKGFWHGLRLQREEVFFAAAQASSQRLAATVDETRQAIEAVNQEIAQMSLGGLEAKEKAVRDSLAKIGAMTEAELAQFIESTEANKERRRQLHHQRLGAEKEAQEAAREASAVASELSETEKEIEAIEERLTSTEVQKEDLERAKEAVQRMEVVFGIRIVEASHCKLVFSVGELVVTGIYDGVHIVDVYAESTTPNVIRKFVASSVSSIPGVLGELTATIPAIVRYILEMASIEKEIELVGVSVPYEVCCTEAALQVQFLVRKGKQGQMGHVSVSLPRGSVRSAITSNIKGFVPREARYGSITQSVAQAKGLAHVK
ncbi:hypothetical protein NEDG_01281 [Nematocida displodere]|uniref:Spc7 kinetochore protein domain-containing protein n=1 Tax=Nematocida displodere TaxID=1805483 RepID=A0A177EBL3_9MICR|nr:hypothetical protein NEDG_01281 [Nematocida displodere]